MMAGMIGSRSTIRGELAVNDHQQSAAEGENRLADRGIANFILGTELGRSAEPRVQCGASADGLEGLPINHSGWELN